MRHLIKRLWEFLTNKTVDRDVDICTRLTLLVAILEGMVETDWRKAR